METEHRVVVGDARSMDALADDSVDLVVTSPPYPLVEMWDETFAALDPTIGDALDAGDGREAFQAMHDVLDAAWAELERVLVPGGIACINVGDATRKIGDEFRLFPNHAEIASRLRGRGLRSLPGILWRKPTNSPNKFMGSGMVPPNAYPTLEHEHLLVFRNGTRRAFPPRDDDRYAAAYFWEERNEWFSDLWEIAGEDQRLAADQGARDRSGAFPVEIPFRLIAMFSTYGDTVLDPFWGTGTTTLAAMVAGRDSVGYERDPEFRAAFDDLVADVPALARERVDARLAAHREFVAERRAEGNPPGYDADHYEFPVVTKQERSIRLYDAVAVDGGTADGTAGVDARYVVTHEPR
jgi:site-specific DNA-methyltransferase (cytosine-N4-specific)